MESNKISDLFDNRVDIEETITTMNSIEQTVSEVLNESIQSKAKQEDGDLPQEIYDTASPQGAIENVKYTAEAREGIEKERAEAEYISLEKLETLYEHLSDKISAMEILFNKKIMHTDYEDKIIDQMHTELQRYKEDLYSQLVRPILLDIIDVRDSIIRIVDAYLKKPEGEQDIPNKVLLYYAYDLQDILEKNNVEIYQSKNGDNFTPIKQRAVKKEITHDENLHGKISESLSCGYSYAGRVISAEKISVYYYEKTEENNIESEDNLNG